MNTFGDRIKAARKHKGITQVQLAAASGVSQAAIGKLELGMALRSRFTPAIAAALNVDPFWLADGTGSVELPPNPVSSVTNRHKSHQFVNQAIRNGYLAKPSTLLCADCGSAAQVYDHRDYNKPLDVDPVCHSCNSKRGAAIPFTHVDDR